MSYDTLDAAILTAIAGGKDKFYLINAAVSHLAKPHSLSDDPFRVVDRRLQALSKRHQIRYWRGKWQLRDVTHAASHQSTKEI